MAETTERIPCPRCDGRGVLPQFYYNRKGICFMCWGRKYITVRIPAGQTKDKVLKKLQKEAAEHFKKHPPKVAPVEEGKRRNKGYWEGANTKVDVADPENHLTDAELAEIKREVDGMTPMQMTETQKALRKQEASKGFDGLPLKDQLRVVARRKMLEARMTKEGIPFEKPKGTPKPNPNPNPNPNGKKGTKSRPEFETIATVGTYTIDKGQHTQTGEDIYRVKNSKRLSRDDFKKESAEMKKMGGYYSKFVGGYLFKEDPTDKLAGSGLGKKPKADELKDGIDAIVNDTSKTPEQRIMALERFHQVEVNAAARNGEINKKEHMALYNYGQEAIERVKKDNKSPEYKRIMNAIDDIMGNYSDDEERLAKYRDLRREIRGLHGDGELTDDEYHELDNIITDFRMDIKERLYRKQDAELSKHQEEVLLPKLLEKHDPYSAEGLQALHDEIAKTWEESSFKNQYLRDLQEQIREEQSDDVVGIYMDRADEIVNTDESIMSLDTKVQRLARMKIEALQDKTMTSKGRNRADDYISKQLEKIQQKIKMTQGEEAKWFRGQMEKRKEILKPKTEEFKDTPLGRKAAALHAKTDKTVEEVQAFGKEARERLDAIREELAGPQLKELQKLAEEAEALDRKREEFRADPNYDRIAYSMVNEEYFAKKREMISIRAKLEREIYPKAYRQLLSEIREAGDILNIGGPTGTSSKVPLSAKNHNKIFNKYGVFFPKQWVDASNTTPMGTERSNGRAFHKGIDRLTPNGNFYPSMMGINQKTDPSTVVHEFMHRMENINPAMNRLVTRFYRNRTDGMDKKWLGRPYGRHEKYRPKKDGTDWIHNYMGKEYDHGWYTNEETGERLLNSTEIMTMGIQGLAYNDWPTGRGYYDKPHDTGRLSDSMDTDYIDFVMGVIASV